MQHKWKTTLCSMCRHWLQDARGWHAQAILNLKKLCNHPKLIYDALAKGSKDAAGFEVGPHITTTSVQSVNA